MPPEGQKENGNWREGGMEGEGHLFLVIGTGKGCRDIGEKN